MKGTAMALVVTVASAGSSCGFHVPPILIEEGARLSRFSCSDLSDSCCIGIEEGAFELRKDGGKGKKGRLMKDFIGTCGRADQVSLYKCAVDVLPRLVPAGKEGKLRQMITAKGCPNVAVSDGTDGSGQCSFSKGEHTLEIDDVSTGCCAAGHAVEALDKAIQDAESACYKMSTGPDRTDEFACYDLVRVKFAEPTRAAQCGIIGACGKKDQESIVKFVKEQGGGGGALQLLETYNFSLGSSQEMMASFMQSEVEDDETEDGPTEVESQIMTGLLGFVAGAAVTGLGVTALRRRTPSQDEYNEVVA